MRGMPSYVDRAVRGSSPRSVISVIAVLTIAALLFIQTGWIIPTPTAQAAGGGTDEDLQLQIRNLLDPGVADSWGNILNNGAPNSNPPPAFHLYNFQHADRMVDFYHTDATLLPTVKNGIWRRTAAPLILDYFSTYFLTPALQPKLLPIPVADQHVVVMGDYASNQGLYTFTLLLPAPNPLMLRKNVKARFTFVYKKVNPNLGWNDPGNAKIMQHHSSVEPLTGCAADLSGDHKVGVPDLNMVINSWGPCP